MVARMITLCKQLFNKWVKSKPYIRFYSLTPGVIDLFPIEKSANLVRPYKSAPDYPDVPSSKNCPAINKITTTGWIVRAPADFLIKTNGDGTTLEWLESYQFNKSSEHSPSSYVVTHGKLQTEALIDDPASTLKTVIKLETPWRVEASDDMVLLQMPVTYNCEPRFTAAIGVLDPKYGHTINVQIFWNVMQGETLVKAGTPLCQFIPVPRSALSTSSYDMVIENATESDIMKEREFNYAANCVILKHDNLASRLARSLKILNKYKNRS
jgi:hypothetical protein